jgi:putative PEP-CTERM system TPR-repeat lipoprotein
MAMEVLRQALAQQGRGEETQAIIAQAAERFPELASAQLAQARELQQTGDIAGAADLLQRVIDTEPDNERARMALIRGHLIARDIDAAAAAADALLAQAPESPMAYSAKGAVLTQQRDFDAARAAFSKALDLDPTFASAALALAALELGTDREDEARQTLDDLLEADPDNVSITLARAAMARRAGGAEAFNARLREALERKPDALQLRLALARSLLLSNDAAAARTLLNEAPPEQRTENALLLLRAQPELTAGDAPAATASLTKLIERNPSAARFRYMLASVFAQQGDLRAAETNLEEGLRLDQDNVLEHGRFAQILAAQPTAEARKGMLDRLSARAPQHPTIRAAQARFLAQQGDFAEADAILTELMAADPDNAAYVVWLADVRQSKDGAKAAEQLMSDWLGEHPGNVPVRLAFAQQSISNADFDLAIEQYRQVIEQDANNAVALNNLAMLLAEKNPDEAMEYADRALALAPDNAAFIDTKGTVLMAKGDYAAAVELLAKAQAESVDPSIAFRYAKALVETGDSSAARRVLLNLQTQSFPERAEAEALLRELSGRD